MDDRTFLSEFESAAIPLERWSHRDHLRVAFLYLRELSFRDALGRLRTGIQALNRANGVLDTPASGYHETVTVAWVRIVAAALANHDPVRDFDWFARANPSLLGKELLRTYYSKERISTYAARVSFVEPDLAPLPGAATESARGLDDR